ncbi:hypothetical protein CCACVL1_03884 [Corchorus capsularis]|uniref:Uncharacterized protein n=1 Tax=Corchorus capsularis TaxID=210143 RepID=A0A1R3JWR6_COCAP|nr:hypothetical protein CCACVL1_03884 [Corchorus capsularis]
MVIPAQSSNQTLALPTYQQ